MLSEHFEALDKMPREIAKDEMTIGALWQYRPARGAIVAMTFLGSILGMMVAAFTIFVTLRISDDQTSGSKCGKCCGV